jgi:membrane protein implicated in regulation of membrane protease activity
MKFFSALISGFAMMALEVLAQVLVLFWLLWCIPWLYRHYGRQGDWWVFIGATAVFTVPLLLMLWYAIRRFRGWKRSRAGHEQQ